MTRIRLKSRSYRRHYLSPRKIRQKFAQLRAALGLPQRHECFVQEEFRFAGPLRQR